MFNRAVCTSKLGNNSKYNDSLGKNTNRIAGISTRRIEKSFLEKKSLENKNILNFYVFEDFAKM